MNEKIKNAWGIVGIIALLMTVGILHQYVVAYSTSIEPTSFRSFSASGEGKIVSVPDVGEFSFGVISEGGTNITDLQKTNTQKMNAAIDFLKKNGVEEKDIKTQQYSVQPRTEYSGCQNNGVCPPPRIVGYTVSQQVGVKMRDFNKIGTIMSGVAQLGVNSVSDLRFTIDDPKKVQNEARAEAIEDAKAKAKAIADAGGFSLGRLLSIEEGVSNPIPYYARDSYAGAIMNEAKLAAPTPTIAAGSEDVVVNVTLRYEIN